MTREQELLVMAYVALEIIAKPGGMETTMESLTREAADLCVTKIRNAYPDILRLKALRRAELNGNIEPFSRAASGMVRQ